MKYGEVEEILKNHGYNSAIEQLRAAVGEEALDLTRGIKGELDEATAVEQAREFFAEDITRWMADGGDPEPETLIGMRARYTKSWAFAQIINNLLMVDREVEVPEVDADTLVRICLANAELGSKLVEMLQYRQDAGQALRLAGAMETMGKLLDYAKAPEFVSSGLRKLAIWERLECILEELEQLREHGRGNVTLELADKETMMETLEEQKGALRKSAENMCWMAQTIHQAHHTDSPFTWKECAQGVCGSMMNMLGQLGFDKDLNEHGVIP